MQVKLQQNACSMWYVSIWPAADTGQSTAYWEAEQSHGPHLHNVTAAASSSGAVGLKACHMVLI
jgi:hypothetical protein